MKIAQYILTFLLLSTLLFSCSKEREPSDSQAEHFVKIFGNYGEDFASEVHQTSDDGYILVGTIATNTYGKDIAVIKTDKFGNEEWSKVFGDSLDNFGNSIKIVDDNFVILGTTTDTTLNTDMYLIKVDASGNLLWEQTFGSSENEEGNDVIVTEDNGFALLGSTTAEDIITGPGGQDSVKNPSGTKDFFLVKTNSNGEPEWTQNYGANKEEFGTKVIERSSGGYVVLGTSASFEDGEFQKKSILAIVINQNGDISGGFNTFGGSENDFGNDIIETSDGYVILGTTSSFSSSGTDMYVVKTDPTLTSIQWESNIGSSSNEAGNSMFLTENDTIYIGGFTDDPSTSNGGKDQYLIRVTPDGSWDEEWGKTFGGSGEELINHIEATSDGGFIFVGSTEFEGVQMINLTKLNSSAEL